MGVAAPYTLPPPPLYTSSSGAPEKSCLPFVSGRPSKRLGRQPWALSLPDKELCLRYFWTGFEKTIYYVDCSLKDFFLTASQMPWFERTLFVITADYSNNEHFQPEYSNVWGMYSIPIAFYYPKKIKPLQSEEIAQQIDLGPSILSALKVNDTL